MTKLEILAEYARTIAESSSSRELLDGLVSCAVSHLGACGAAALQIVEEGPPHIEAEAGLPGVLGWEADDVEIGGDLGHRVVEAAGLEPNSVETWPLVSGGDLFGALILCFESPEGLDHEVADLATPLIDLAAVALAKVRQHERLQRSFDELRQRNNQLLQAQKMEAIGRLASGVAHDFNNLLMAVSGCARVALESIASDAPARRWVEEISRSAIQGASITRQLLTFSRRGDDAAGPARLDAAVAAAETMLRHLLGEDVALGVELGAVNGHIRCDETQTEQVLMNLAVNARDAMVEGGSLSIVTGERVLGEEDAQRLGLVPGPHLVLSVSDTGSGMPPEVVERIFDPFFTTKGPTEGTGLGLSTVYNIVTGSGGSIEVTSEPGSGTRFEILFPRVEAPVESTIEAAQRSRARRSATVLLVEDDEVVRVAVRHFLEGAGYRVLEAATGEAALAMLRADAGGLDLLLTDVVMPGMSGPRLGEHARELDPHLAILYMSAHGRDALVGAGRLDADAEALQKPFTEGELLDRVDALLGGPPAEIARPAGAEAGPRPLTILLVEDNEGARLAAAALLEDLEHRVLVAGDGAEALAACAAIDGGIDVLLTDIGLPDIGGHELVEKLRQSTTIGGVVYLSGRSADDPQLAAALSRPATAFLQKPVDFDQLLAVLDRVATPRG